METAIKLEHVSKYFGGRKVVDDLNLETYAGEVFGFLGPNGAGKTTTIKMLVGMLRIDEGTASIGGFDITRKFEKAMGRVGGIVENPEMYRYMTGYQNLKQYARMRKGVTGQRIEDVVELVGLSNRIHEKVSKYSLGMRQRLGVAQALLHHPDVLILDEPTNGLDPAGIRHLRDILRDLAHKENICVLVSSHLMSEMQLMCDRVGIIGKGKLINVTSVEELVNNANGSIMRYRYYVDDAEGAKKLASDAFQMDSSKEEEGEDSGVKEIAHKKKIGVSVLDEHHLEIQFAKEDADKINTWLADWNKQLIMAGIQLYTVSPVETQRLEDAFIELTKGDEQIV